MKSLSKTSWPSPELCTETRRLVDLTRELVESLARGHKRDEEAQLNARAVVTDSRLLLASLQEEGMPRDLHVR